MCGIAGIFGQASADLLEAKAKRMISALRHRGPDGEGVWVSPENGLVLAHRRLAIQDLSDHGKQPMFSPSKRYCVVYNGEIYNFKELAADLSRCGHHFSGHSDTEVLLAAIDEWGLIHAVQKFIGMFSFALWDKKERVLHLCRDRLGEKPLYYGWIGKDFYFASELKAIEQVVDQASLNIDNDGLANFLRYGYIAAPFSIYQGIYKLMPGTIISLPVAKSFDPSQFSPWPGKNTYSPTPYWSVLNAANQGLSNLITDENEAIDTLDKLLHRTVRRQMIADVNVGTFLSGGIDSTLISAIAQNEASGRVKTFTIGFEETEYDESPYAEKISQHLGTDHVTVHVSSRDALNVIPDLSSIYDEPFADSSQIPSYLVSKIARQHVTVCLSGDGGDELFAGYNRYLWLEHIWKRVESVPFSIRKLIGQILSVPSPAIWDRLYSIMTLAKSNKEKQHLVGLKVQKLAGLIQKQDIMHGYDYLMSYWVQPEKIMCLGQSSDTSRIPSVFPSSNEFIDKAMYWDQMAYLQGDNLAKVDRASMAVSLETRLPLLSHEIVEFSWQTPIDMKVRRGTSKWLLRKVLDRYVPRHLIERPKMGFSVPIAHWLRNDLREWAEDLLNTIHYSQSEFFHEEPIRKAWNEHISGKRDHSHRLWSVLMYLSWRAGRP